VEGADSSVDLGVPGPRGLVEAIERLAKFADEMGVADGNIAFWLGNVDILKEVAIEEGGFDVEVANRLTSVASEGNQGA
jgi:hypothetical protein